MDWDHKRSPFGTDGSIEPNAVCDAEICDAEIKDWSIETLWGC